MIIFPRSTRYSMGTLKNAKNANAKRLAREPVRLTEYTIKKNIIAQAHANITASIIGAKYDGHTYLLSNDVSL